MKTVVDVKFKLQKNYTASWDPSFTQIASAQHHKNQSGHCQLIDEFKRLEKFLINSESRSQLISYYKASRIFLKERSL